MIVKYCCVEVSNIVFSHTRWYAEKYHECPADHINIFNLKFIKGSMCHVSSCLVCMERRYLIVIDS